MIFHRVLLAAALGIAVFMLAPPTSPVLSSGGLFTAVEADPTEAETVVKPKPRPKRVEAKGVLMTGWSAGGAKFGDIVALTKRTELNAVVLDIKDEAGEVSWLPKNPALREFGAGRNKIKDLPAKLAELKEAGLYVIGRIVTMQDPVLSEARPDLAARFKDGGIWRNDKGLGWADPYSREVWEYNIGLATEAVEAGFDEIQFDYIRFPSDGPVEGLWFPHRDHRQPTEVIRGFFAEARSRIVPLGGYLSADLFGLVTLVTDDLGIGQRIELIAQEVDYLSLMLYPSHYTNGNYGIDFPERNPYDTVSKSVIDAKRRITGTRARLRPWLQDFSLDVRYSPDLVRAQINAVEDQGVNEWLLWNAANRYSEDALRPAEQR